MIEIFDTDTDTIPVTMMEYTDPDIPVTMMDRSMQDEEVATFSIVEYVVIDRCACEGLFALILFFGCLVHCMRRPTVAPVVVEARPVEKGEDKV
jgi:hypothetical protein